MNTHVVIMAGGIGSRMWPLSTPELPKQFIDVLGCGRSLIQLTFDRFAPICDPANIWVVTNAGYVDMVHAHLPLVREDHILAEPAARNTAPCIAWACWCIREADPDANVVVAPSDAVVMDPVEFRRIVCAALDFTQSREAIVTLGILPTRPETGYGYVKTCGDAVSGSIFSVEQFKEKPNLETAKRYLAEGGYFWNAGIFVWSVKTVEKMLQRYCPALVEKIASMTTPELVAEIFPTCEKISIDYAVMEPAAADGLVYTHPSDFGWSDLGNWASIHEKLSHDADGNGVVGNVALHECSNCVVHAEDLKKVILQGLDGYIVSEKGGRLIVCKRSEEQRIKEFSEQ